MLGTIYMMNSVTVYVCLPFTGVCGTVTFVKIVRMFKNTVRVFVAPVQLFRTVVSETPVSHKHPHEVPPL